jgi:two-component system chemotaxis response regulator CheY
MKINVLIVDDSAVIRSVIKKALRMAEVEVGETHEAGNGEEALAILDKTWVDVVFADINMPIMDGVELVDRMAANDLLETVPVVMVSSDRRASVMKKLEACGVRAYVKKPFRPEKLLAAIQDVLGEAHG